MREREDAIRDGDVTKLWGIDKKIADYRTREMYAGPYDEEKKSIGIRFEPEDYMIVRNIYHDNEMEMSLDETGLGSKILVGRMHLVYNFIYLTSRLTIQPAEQTIADGIWSCEMKTDEEALYVVSSGYFNLYIADKIMSIQNHDERQMKYAWYMSKMASEIVGVLNANRH